MSIFPRSLLLLLVVAPILVGLPGCGGDDDSDEGAGLTSRPEPPNIPEGTPTTAPEPPNIPDESPTDTGDEGGLSTQGYPAEVRDNFLGSCTAQPNATQTACECALGKIEARVSFRDFRRADVAMRTGSRVDPQIQTQISNAIADCV